jgi:hypothetical protein
MFLIWLEKSRKKNSSCFINIIVVYLIIQLPKTYFMKEMINDLIKGYKQEKREFWEGVIVLISIFGLTYFSLIIFH